MLLENQLLRNELFSCINVIKHRIQLLKPNAASVHSPSYRDRPRNQKSEKEEGDKKPIEYIIEPAQIVLTAPIAEIIKKNRTLCQCVDYSKLDTTTEKDLFTILRMKEFTTSLREVAVFSTSDANNGY